MTNIVVLGSGMAGFGAATYLRSNGIRPVLYDQAPFFGGHTASFRDPQGFLFDQGPHISFTKDPRIQALFARYVDEKYEAVQVKLDNYWQGLRLTHPVQLHLNGLPHDLIVEIISDFVKEHGTERPINNYEDWLLASYGKKFAETFPMQYTRKYHLTEASNMSTDWLGPRMYRPSLEEMLRGALAPWAPEVHYITNFRYPTSGGFVSYLRDLPSIADIRLEHEVVAILGTGAALRQRIHRKIRWARLLDRLAGPRSDDRGNAAGCIDASQQLACSTCVLVNVGVNRQDLSEGQITYIYDQDVCFTRELSAPAFRDQRPAGVREHSSRSVLFEQVSSADAVARFPHRSGNRGPSPNRHVTGGRPDPYAPCHSGASRECHFRSQSRRRPEDGSRVPRRPEDRVLRPIRRLGIHVDR